VANRAGPFGPSGFPRPVGTPAARSWHRVLHHPQAFAHHSHAVVAGAATAVAAAGVVAVVFIAGAHHGRSAEPAGGATHVATGDSTSPSSAHGGPGRSDPAGRLAVSPASGSLAAGAGVTITVTSTSLVALDGQLTVNPGGHTITVVLSVGL
jgi:hypothetical protein